jgi:hypothetical protein
MDLRLEQAGNLRLHRQEIFLNQIIVNFRIFPVAEFGSIKTLIFAHCIRETRLSHFKERASFLDQSK